MLEARRTSIGAPRGAKPTRKAGAGARRPRARGRRPPSGEDGSAWRRASPDDARAARARRLRLRRPAIPREQIVVPMPDGARCPRRATDAGHRLVRRSLENVDRRAERARAGATVARRRSGRGCNRAKLPGREARAGSSRECRRRRGRASRSAVSTRSSRERTLRRTDRSGRTPTGRRSSDREASRLLGGRRRRWLGGGSAVDEPTDFEQARSDVDHDSAVHRPESRRPPARTQPTSTIWPSGEAQPIPPTRRRGPRRDESARTTWNCASRPKARQRANDARSRVQASPGRRALEAALRLQGTATVSVRVCDPGRSAIAAAAIGTRAQSPSRRHQIVLNCSNGWRQSSQ